MSDLIKFELKNNMGLVNDFHLVELNNGSQHDLTIPPYYMEDFKPIFKPDKELLGMDLTLFIEGTNINLDYHTLNFKVKGFLNKSTENFDEIEIVYRYFIYKSLDSRLEIGLEYTVNFFELNVLIKTYSFKINSGYFEQQVITTDLYNKAPVLVQCLDNTRVEPPTSFLVGFKWYSNNNTISSFPVNFKKVFITDLEPLTNNNIGDDSEEDGYEEGKGAFDDSSDDLLEHGMPTSNIFNTGMISMYEMDDHQLNKLSDFLWSSNFFDSVVKLFSSPFDVITNLKYIPVSTLLITKRRQKIKLGNVLSDIYSLKCLDRYIVIDCGEVSLLEYFNTYLDYAPNTTIQLYLPFVSTVNLDCDKCMNCKINVSYFLDLMTGQAMCEVKSTNIDTNVSIIIHNSTCTISSDIPLSASDFSSLYMGLASTTGAVVGGLMTGGVGALALGAMASSTLINSKPSVSQGNAISSNTGVLGILKPYLIITRPIQVRPYNFNNLKGYKSEVTARLGNIMGYTECKHVQLQNMSCTKNECEEIKRLLESGVYL